MKIAIFTDIYAPWGDGGIASSVKAQRDALVDLGHEVVVFCPGGGISGRNDVVIVPSHQRLRINGAMIAKRPGVVEEFVLNRFPDFRNFDLVHVHYEASCSIAGIRLAKKFNLPLVQTMHGREDAAIAINVPMGARSVVAGLLNILHGKYLAHEKVIKKDKYLASTFARRKMWELMINHANAADLVLSPSEHFAQKLRHYGVTREVMVVSNGVPRGLAQGNIVYRVLENSEPLKLIWNSRVSREKRIMEFLAALTKVQRPYQVEVFGNGNMLKRAKKYVKKHRLNVKFLGARARVEIMKHMLSAHMAVVASCGFDTQGMVLLEAEVMGLPVFFCDPDMKEVVPCGGYLMSADASPIKMAEAIDSLTAGQITNMSKVLLAHRSEVWQETQVKCLLKAYRKAILAHAR